MKRDYRNDDFLYKLFFSVKRVLWGYFLDLWLLFLT